MLSSTPSGQRRRSEAERTQGMRSKAARASAGGANEIIKDLEAPFVVLEFPDVGLKDPRGATVHRIVGGLDQKILVPEAGFLIQNCVDATRTDWYGTALAA